MKVVRWTSYDEDLPNTIDEMGGFFSKGMRWIDYAKIWTEEGLVFINAIREEILRIELKYAGAAHQYEPDGMPVFEDGTCARFSFRAWGDLMAAVWSEVENKDYSYMDFYC